MKPENRTPTGSEVKQPTQADPSVKPPHGGGVGHGIRTIIKKRLIRVSCERVRVRQGEWIRWYPEDPSMKFHIHFDKNGSPFSQTHLIDPSPQSWHQAVNQGDFKYTVIDENDSKNRLDPDVVVDPPMP